MKCYSFLKKKWHKRYLVLDRCMSGKFFRLFSVTLTSVILLFILLYSISHILKGWSAGEVFIQMTNPSPTNKLMDNSDWFLIVTINLFGMFVVNGVLLTLLLNWLTNRRERYLNGYARYGLVKSSRFSVIIGGHSIVAHLVVAVMEKDDVEYIIIQSKRNPNEIRQEIDSQLSDKKKVEKIIIYSGDRTSWHELEDLHITLAQGVYIIGENDSIDNGAHDAFNLKCWDLLRTNLTEPRNIKLPCNILLENQGTFHIFQTTDIDLDDTRTFRFIPFSIEQCWARRVLSGNPLSSNKTIKYIPMDGDDGIGYETPNRVHLVIAGSNQQALSLFFEGAHLAHYPNFLNSKFGNPTTLITIIDRNMKSRLEEMQNRLPHFFSHVKWRFVSAPDVFREEHMVWEWEKEQVYDNMDNLNYLGDNLIDIEFEFIEGDISMSSIRDYLLCSLNSGGKKVGEIMTLAICDDNDHIALQKALSLPEYMYSHTLQILVQQQILSNIIDGIREGNTGAGINRYHKLLPFGMKNEIDCLSLFEEKLPQYVNFAYSKLNQGSSFMNEYEKTKNDIHLFNALVAKEWQQLEQEGGKTCMAKRWSNYYSSDSFFSKMRSVKSKVILGEVITDSIVLEWLSKTEHNRWVMEQLLLGMCPPGKEYANQLPIEDNVLRKKMKRRGIHPDLISNDKLGSTSKYDVEIVKLIPFILNLSSK